MFMEDNTIVNTATLLVIVFSTACFVLETEFKDPSLIEMWFGFESFAVSIFTIEYAVRLMACPRKYSFVLQPLNVVDLIAIVPYYIALIYSASVGVDPWQQSNSFSSAGTVFRAVRLFRIFRVFKLGRYSAGLQVFWGALAHSGTSLLLLLFLMVICILLFSSVMYLVEDQGSSEAADCPMGVCQFRSIPSTFWWAIVTMTTVGYGDAVPVTVAGKVVAGATMICGIIVIALPISVLGNNFTKLMQQFADESLIITQADLDGSGFVDAAEVARWLDAMRKAGKIRDERLTAEELLRRYDRGGNVGLERKELLRMCREVVHQGGPSNRELLSKLQRLGTQLDLITERLEALEHRGREVSGVESSAADGRDSGGGAGSRGQGVGISHDAD